MYIGEWNEVSREEKINENGNLAFRIDRKVKSQSSESRQVS